MNIDNKLDVLKKINKVEAPPFLLTRVKQQIHNLSNVEAPIKWKWAFAVGFLCIITGNLFIIFKSNLFMESKSISVKNIVNEMNLSSKIDLYHE